MSPTPDTYPANERGSAYWARIRLKKPSDCFHRFRFFDGKHWACGPPTEWQPGPIVTSGTSGAVQVTGLSATPTAAGAQLTFALPSAAQVQARVLNLAGRPVKTLCAMRDCEPGTNTLLWNATSDQGTRVPNGTYLVEVTAKTDEGESARAVARVNLTR